MTARMHDDDAPQVPDRAGAATWRVPDGSPSSGESTRRERTGPSGRVVAFLYLAPAALAAAVFAACLQGWNYPTVAFVLATSLAIVGGAVLARRRTLGLGDRMAIAAATGMALAGSIMLLFDLADLSVGPVADSTLGWMAGSIAGYGLFALVLRRQAVAMPHAFASGLVVASVLLALLAEDLLHTALNAAAAPGALRVALSPLTIASAIPLLLWGLRRVEQLHAPPTASLILVAWTGIGLVVLGDSGHEASEVALPLGTLACALVWLAWAIENRQWLKRAAPRGQLTEDWKSVRLSATIAGAAFVCAALPVLVLGERGPAPLLEAVVMFLCVAALVSMAVLLACLAALACRACFPAMRVPFPRPAAFFLAVALGGQLLLLGMIWLAVRVDLSGAEILVKLDQHMGLPGLSHNEVAHALMRDQYLWFEERRTGDDVSAPDARSAIRALRIERDRWSGVSDANYRAAVAEGQEYGYGQSVRQEGHALVVSHVEAGSPADRSGVRRGFQLVELEGQSMLGKTLSEVDLITARGEPIRLIFRAPDGSGRDVRLEPKWFQSRTVPIAKTLESDGQRIGYVLLERFSPAGVREFRKAVAAFRAQGLEHLVLDLRYNPGGGRYNAVEIASLIVGSELEGKVFARTTYNRRYRDRDREDRFIEGEPDRLGMRRLFVITTKDTCSASELLVNGLRAHIEVVTVGSTTCGKPYGYTGVSHEGQLWSVITFEVANAKGEGGYVDGLAPTCPAKDDLAHELGDPREASLWTVLEFIRDGRCPALKEAESDLRSRHAMR